MLIHSSNEVHNITGHCLPQEKREIIFLMICIQFPSFYLSRPYSGILILKVMNLTIKGNLSCPLLYPWIKHTSEIFPWKTIFDVKHWINNWMLASSTPGVERRMYNVRVQKKREFKILRWFDWCDSFMMYIITDEKIKICFVQSVQCLYTWIYADKV